MLNPADVWAANAAGVSALRPSPGGERDGEAKGRDRDRFSYGKGGGSISSVKKKKVARLSSAAFCGTPNADSRIHKR